MKRIFLFAIALTFAAVVCVRSGGQSPDAAAGQKYEYASVRFMGNHTSFVWQDGTVEKFADLTNNAKKPDAADDRMWYLTLSMNIAARKGFEPVALSLTSDDVVFRRAVAR